MSIEMAKSEVKVKTSTPIQSMIDHMSKLIEQTSKTIKTIK